MIKSVLNVTISCFENYRTSDNPKSVNLLQWLQSSKYAKQVQRIRNIKDKKDRDELKANLPAITPSGQFSYRSKDNLIKHSGLIQFDIDGQDHLDISNFKTLKDEISKIKNVAYVGLSVSGRGYWGLIPIKYPDKHKQHFKAMKKAFEGLGLELDDKPSHAASLRGYSYDPDAYFNHQARPFELLYELESRNQAREKKSYSFRIGIENEIEKLISKIQEKRIDITDGYDNWVRLGFALTNEFGEKGRRYFHAVSQYHPEYNERETDRQYSHCMYSKGEGVTIATFFHICKQQGLFSSNS